MKTTWKWLPPWNMPSDPVQAVIWCVRWLLQVLVRYFWLLILVAVAFEAYLNGWVGLLGTLLIGLFVWGILAVALFVLTIVSGVSRIYEEVNRFQQPFAASMRQ